MSAQSFEDLIVWQKAHTYVLSVYKITKQYPKEEIFGLVNQLRRAAISITANIAEGFVRISNKEKLRFYNISQGSLEEIRSYLETVLILLVLLFSVVFRLFVFFLRR